MMAGLAACAAQLKLPDEGMYLSSGVYRAVGRLIWQGGPSHTEWSPELPSQFDVPDLAKRDNQGNALQFWQSGDVLTNLASRLYKNGLSAMAISTTKATPEQIKWLHENGNWICYDLHEMFSFSLYIANEDKDAGDAELLSKYTLKTAADDLVARVRRTVDKKHAEGWKLLTSSSGQFHLDYLMLGGLDIPGLEFYPFPDTSIGQALCRGMARQYGVNVWHAYLAHDWYSYLPHTNPHKMDTLAMMLRQQYMGGAKIVTLESGNWWLQSNLCPDSPQSYMPQIGEKLKIGPWMSEEASEKATTPDERLEARRRFAWIDYRSPVASKYRKIMSDFWDFCKANPAPKGQPEAVIALAKGNLDIASQAGSAFAVAGAYKLAEKDHRWMGGAPERSWQIVKDIFCPKPENVAPERNLFYSASPYGQVDIVSFAGDNVTAEYLLRNYKAIVFSGWNTCSPKQYKVLADYVKGGGRLCIALSHLSTNDRRNYDFFKKEELVNGGDFSELCGLKVTARGGRFYWATGTSRKKNALGLAARRRYGVMGIPLGKLEFTAPKENYEFLAVDDESAEPVILRCRSGKGEVYFMNIWHYPAEANRDNGAGALLDSKGLIGELYSLVARETRGNVWITGPDFNRPDEDCNWINYSYFPDAGKIYLMNLDYDRERRCVLQWFGEKDFITLKPGEFRIMDAPVLTSEEKLNEM